MGGGQRLQKVVPESFKEIGRNVSEYGPSLPRASHKEHVANLGPEARSHILAEKVVKMWELE